ncbi:MAG TPA: NAD-dependent epimerase/dehydratase family protein [Solirubrobacterales bacterium]|nr:NAD-dependent epimerase/dehydratase family protein [Solirubrobacterales bacterium]
MRVVVVGATGNVGTSVVRALAADSDVNEVIGAARRVPEFSEPGVSWRAADITHSDLAELFSGADAVVHLAWAIQPSRDADALRATNVLGSERVLDGVSKAGVPRLVYASSVGAYSPGPKDRAVDEAWPTDGIETSFYSRHKAEVESLLDEFETGQPGVRVVRLRPGLIFKREAATEIRRLFLGPFVPRIAFHRRALFAIPDVERLRFQAVHSDDVAEAYRLAVTHEEAQGAYNVAAEPVLDPDALAEALDARKIAVSSRVLRGLAAATWRARLQPTPEGWLDMALGVPIMSSAKIRNELGWEPRRDAQETLLELLAGLRDGAGHRTPPLDPASSGPLRIQELKTGIGARAY